MLESEALGESLFLANVHALRSIENVSTPNPFPFASSTVS